MIAVSKHGLDEPNQEVSALISHAVQERLKTLVEKLSVIAEHRMDFIKVNNQTIFWKSCFHCYMKS